MKMGAYCQVTGKTAMSGNNVSHARNHTKRRFLPNLKIHKFWVEAMQRFVRLRVSANGMRTIDKRGIEQVLLDMYNRGEKVLGINLDALQAAVKEKTNG